jgi:hypothetical protein
MLSAHTYQRSLRALTPGGHAAGRLQPGRERPPLPHLPEPAPDRARRLWGAVEQSTPKDSEICDAAW